MTTLVHVERLTDVRHAIAREKQIKGWTRAKKIALIEAATQAGATCILSASDDSSRGMTAS